MARQVLLNSNVPCAILLHHARKCYMKEESALPGRPPIELPVSMGTLPEMLDFAAIEGEALKVVGLGAEPKDTLANTKLEERAEYVLVMKKEAAEEGEEATYIPLCTKYQDMPTSA